MRLLTLIFSVLIFLAPAFAETRMALVIGNGNYASAPKLPNVANDLAAMAAKFSALGFQVTSASDLDQRTLRATMTSFAKAAENADIVALYFAGFGMMAKGADYVIPTDFKGETSELALKQSVSLTEMLQPLENTGEKIIVFLDMTRNVLFPDLAAGDEAYVMRADSPQMLLSFAASPGEMALDGDGQSSPYTEALLKHLGTPGSDVSETMMRVRAEVFNITKGAQKSWEHSNLMSPLILKTK